MENKMKEIYIFPFHGENKIPGAEIGPIEVVKQLDFYYSGLFKYVFLPLVHTEQELLDFSNLIYSSVKKNKVTLILGGDHSTTSYIFEKILKQDLQYVNIIFDAHNDNTNIKQKEYYNWNVISHIQNHVKYGLIIGYRDVRASMPQSEKYIYLSDWEEKEVVKSQIRSICKESPNIYISIDLDVINPIEFPGTGYLYAGGIFVREMICYLQTIIKYSENIIVDLVEFNPLIEKDRSLGVIVRIIQYFYEFI